MSTSGNTGDTIIRTYANPSGVEGIIKELDIPLDSDIKDFKQIKKTETNSNNDLGFYNEIIKIIIEVRKKRDTTKHNINSFNIDIKNALKEKDFKINYYGKQDKDINYDLIKIYKDNFSMTINCKTFEALSYCNYNFNNNMNENKEVQYLNLKNDEIYPNYKDVLQIKELGDGPMYHIIFDNFKKEFLITTTKNLLGKNGTVYDGINHKEFFIEECKKRGIDLNLILNYFIENNLNNMVMVFTLRHFSTPIPLEIEENSMKLVEVYKINNNVEILTELDTNYTTWKTSKFMNSECVEKINSSISNIKEFITYYDLGDFVSFCNNNNIGEFEKNKEYEYSDKENLSNQFCKYFNSCSNKNKGFLVYTSSSIEIVYNNNYMDLINLRPTISLNLLETNDKVINKLLFKYQLGLFYKSIPKEKFYEKYTYLVEKFKIDVCLKENTRKVNEWIKNLVELYNDIYINKTKEKIDIPNCYKYKTENQYYKDFVYMIHQEYKNISSNKHGGKIDINSLIKKEIIFERVLREYENNQYCIYGDMWGKIMTPDMRTKRSIYNSNENRQFMQNNDI